MLSFRVVHRFTKVTRKSVEILTLFFLKIDLGRVSPKLSQLGRSSCPACSKIFNSFGNATKTTTTTMYYLLYALLIITT